MGVGGWVGGGGLAEAMYLGQGSASQWSDLLPPPHHGPSVNPRKAHCQISFVHGAVGGGR